MGLTLQPAARRDLVDVAVNVDLQQRARMIGWTSGRFWNHTVKAQRPEIQRIDKHVDHPHRVVLSNVVIQILWDRTPCLRSSLWTKRVISQRGCYVKRY